MSDLNCDIHLRFDSVKMDTSLAEEYLKTNRVFHSTECCKKDVQEIKISDSCDNTIYCIDRYTFCNSERPSNLSIRMRTLAEKLKNNEDLFAQLDYMVRQESVDEGRIHMDLIVKQFFYWSLNLEENDHVDYGNFTLDETDSATLLRLGIVAFALVHYSSIYIHVTRQMAVICHLFTTLCHEVGLRNIHLVLMNEIEGYHQMNHIDYSSNCCTGIITEHSDLDSALDVLLASNSTSPWSLKHIYVQENIYENFKGIMKWKCKKNLKEDSNNRFDVYEYGAKIFILDHFNVDDVTDKHVVKVEAYRTTKELLSLINDCKPDYVSLWASDIAEANEIALGVNCKVVWINDFGNFKGPVEVSNSLFQNVSSGNDNLKVSKRQSERSKIWENLSIEKRQQILLDSLRNYESAHETGKEFCEFIDKLKRLLVRCKNGFIDVSSGVMCIGIRKPVGMLHISTVSHKDHFVKSIASLAYGNTILLKQNIYQIYKDLFDILIKSDVPIFIDDVVITKKDTISLDLKLYYTANFTYIKIVYMPYGTIFAN